MSVQHTVIAFSKLNFPIIPSAINGRAKLSFHYIRMYVMRLNIKI